MAPDESDRREDHSSEPPPPQVDPEGFMQEAPRTNGGATAPPETFGVAGDPQTAREQAAESPDPRGEQAPEEDRLNEPSA
ncbi:MAG TPA: hypothetical protein VFJ14_15605 [Nocardioidaceae bacterium]|nr:hypothetical protein [Nocardioidaceae bacterium]